MKVRFVAGPLVARTGVYRSAYETVKAARNDGYDWSLTTLVSSAAPGQRVEGTSWYEERTHEPAGVAGVVRLAKIISQQDYDQHDLFISMTPQTDMALALLNRRYVAYVRGLPWPGPGEAPPMKRQLWKLLEKLALRRAQSVWTTTPKLRDDIADVPNVKLVLPGIEPTEGLRSGTSRGDRAVWAARFNLDKNPHFVLEIFRELPNVTCFMYGSGPLASEIEANAPANVTVAGFVSKETLWDEAFVYLGTSFREGFGRSAVEAAMAGVPVVVASSFGCAEMLYTDSDLYQKYVLPLGNPRLWADAIASLSDEKVARDVAAHVLENANRLTIVNSVEAIAREVRELDGMSTSGRGHVADEGAKWRSL